MSYEKSDLRDRLPLFEPYKDSIGDLSGRAYDYIDPTVTSMMAGCVPVGLNPDNTLAIPKSYEPEEGPPVLMLRPGEQVSVRWSEGMEKAMAHIFRRANVISGPSDMDLDFERPMHTDSYVEWTGLSLDYPDHPQKDVEDLFIPLYAGMQAQHAPIGRTASLLHECDHWDFLLNAAPRFSFLNAAKLPPDGKLTLAEKRAFTTNYVRMANTGLTGYFMDAEQLVQSLHGATPSEVGKNARKLAMQFTLPKLNMATVAVALSMRFGDNDTLGRVNQQEIDAYKAAGLIHH